MAREKHVAHVIRPLDLQQDHGEARRPFEARADVVDFPGDFLLVGRQGSPDFDQEPLAISIAKMSSYGAYSMETSAVRPVKQTGARLLLAHEGLVSPVHELFRQSSPAGQLADFEKKSVRMLILLGLREEMGIIAAHVLYPSSEESDEISSALFVPRRIAEARGTIGEAGADNQWQNLDIDLLDLVAKEQAGGATRLRKHYSLEARTLAAIGMLANQMRLKADLEKYKAPPVTVVIEAGTMLREE